MKSPILVAGLAGGMAEIAWVLAYGAFTPVGAAEVAREVAASVIPGAAQWAAAPALGVAIHLMLSIALAYAFVAALPGRHGIFAIAVGALVGVWAINFLVLLPLVNPRFVTLMPHAATLFSKMLFGAAMAAVLAARVPKPEASQEHHRPGWHTPGHEFRS